MPDMEPRYLNIQDACLRKGVKHNSIRLQEFRQPHGGVPEKKIKRADGKIQKYWSYETIQEWLDIFDDELPDYLMKWMNDKSIGNHVKALFLEASRKDKIPGWLTVELEHLKRKS